MLRLLLYAGLISEGGCIGKDHCLTVTAFLLAASLSQMALPNVGAVLVLGISQYQQLLQSKEAQAGA